jgi:hypothetical protein
VLPVVAMVALLSRKNHPWGFSPPEAAGFKPWR